MSQAAAVAAGNIFSSNHAIICPLSLCRRKKCAQRGDTVRSILEPGEPTSAAETTPEPEADIADAASRIRDTADGNAAAAARDAVGGQSTAPCWAVRGDAGPGGRPPCSAHGVQRVPGARSDESGGPPVTGDQSSSSPARMALIARLRWKILFFSRWSSAWRCGWSLSGMKMGS